MRSHLHMKRAAFSTRTAAFLRCTGACVPRRPLATISAPSPLQQQVHPPYATRHTPHATRHTHILTALEHQAANVSLTRNEELLACACSDYEYRTAFPHRIFVTIGSGTPPCYLRLSPATAATSTASWLDFRRRLHPWRLR
jgi:hypothetical protein